MLTIGKADQMLWTIAGVLIVLWLLGMTTGFIMGNFIHVLLAAAIIIVLFRLSGSRSTIR